MRGKLCVYLCVVTHWLPKLLCYVWLIIVCLYCVCGVFVNWVASQTAAWHTWLALMEVIVAYINQKFVFETIILIWVVVWLLVVILSFVR